MSVQDNSISRPIIYKRIRIIAVMISAILLCLEIKLYFIMIVNNKQALQGVMSQIYKPVIYYEGFDFKGCIYDCNLKKLTNDGLEYKAIIVPEMVWERLSKGDRSYLELVGLIGGQTAGTSYSDLMDRIEKEYNGNRSAVVLTVDNLVKEKIIKYSLPGIYVKEENKKYGDSVGFSIISNFINNKVNSNDLKNHDSTDMKIFNYIARYGKHILKIPVDARNHTLLGHDIVEEIQYNSIEDNTKDVVLTMDYHIQKIAEDTLAEMCQNAGAVSIIKVKTGEVLAMASKDKNGWERNMVTYSGSDYAYNPGSIFKVTVLAAALEEGNFDTNTKFNCTGRNEATGISCYKAGGHGLIGLEDAFASSCNVYFIELAMKTGAEKIIEMAKRFGFGEKVLNFSRESRGMLYRNISDITYDIGNIAIGQKDIMVTPIQACDMISTIANNGIRNKPFILKRVLDSSGNICEEFQCEKNRVVSEKTAKTIQELLEIAVQKGTGKNAQISVGAAGKTGTPQRGVKTKEGKYPYEDGWFVGYFPASNPEYAMSVYVEDIGSQGSGGNIASPIFKEIAEKILLNNLT